MTTKESIENEALSLFCMTGYAGVSIRDIAKKVGIKESSIYKHYKNKESIFETIKVHYLEKTQDVFRGATNNQSVYAKISGDTLIAMIQTTFRAFASDDYISKCRKLFMISAPGNSEIGKMYAESFISIPIAYNRGIFQMVIQSTSRNEIDTEAMAYQFYSPVFCMLQEFDYGVLTMDEALEKIKKVTKEFLEVYKL